MSAETVEEKETIDLAYHLEQILQRAQAICKTRTVTAQAIQALSTEIWSTLTQLFQRLDLAAAQTSPTFDNNSLVSAGIHSLASLRLLPDCQEESPKAICLELQGEGGGFHTFIRCGPQGERILTQPLILTHRQVHPPTSSENGNLGSTTFARIEAFPSETPGLPFMKIEIKTTSTVPILLQPSTPGPGVKRIVTTVEELKRTIAAPPQEQPQP